ncbi:MAG: LytTR family DNA-binding domain-containing protein [Bacteroidales bacterium]|nr:LytTR family DNA-binding domain-containing protein [Bacteroidales bacterium]
MTDFCIFVEKSFMINAILISNDESTRNSITKTVETYCPNVTLVASANDVKSSIGAINEHEPDLVLLDIKLKDGSGFELLDHFGKPEFKVVFLSNYSDYAIKAIKHNAIDYLLKPVKDEELAQAIKKADDLIRYEEKLQAKALGESIKNINKSHRMVLKSQDQVHVVDSVDIIRIEADGNYSTFYLTEGRKIVVSKSTKEYEEALLDQGFHRIHKSHIVNINKMSYFDKADGGILVMCNGDQVPVASRKRDMLMELFDSLT